MKVTLTRAELLKILTSHLGYEVTELTISKEPKKNEYNRIANALAAKLGWTQNSITPGERFGAHKIPAIKALREIIPGLGLAESKWIIEHWQDWSYYVVKHNRIPKVQFTGSGYEANLV